MVQVIPSISPRLTSSTMLKICRVTALRGAFRHDVSLPGRSSRADPRGGVSRSGETLT
jgi:hypothetical protein